MMSRRLRFGLATVLALMLVLALSTAAAATDPGGAPSGDGVDPIFVAGNPSCATLNADNTTFPSITSGYGFKLNGAPTGTFPFDGSNGGTLEGVAPSDPGNSVTISNVVNSTFDWSATLGIDAVIVKGGPNADAFVYDPDDTADTDLHAPVNPSNNEYYGLSHIEFCYDYNLSASKTANATYTRTYTWTIDKTVDDDSHTGWAGDTFESNYDVVVEQTVNDTDFAVSGSITVNNPTPHTVSFTVTDSVGGTPAVVNCPTLTLAAGASMICSYSATLASTTGGINTATITSSTAGVDGTTASASYAFGDPTTVVGYPTVNVDDTFEGPLGSASSDATFEYDRDFECPTDPDMYEDGVYTESFPNTATIVETDQSDDETVNLTCYILLVEKAVDAATYDITYAWDVTKTVDPLSQSGYAGDLLEWTWDVDVTKTPLAQDNFALSGTIDVHNPSDEQITVDVADTLDDSTPVSVDCDDATLGDQTSLTIAAGTTGTCAWFAAPDDASATLNTATVTLDGNDYTATAPVDWASNDVNGMATLTDDQIGLDEDLSGDGPWSFTADDDHTCSTAKSDYGADGTYSATIDNTAVLTPQGQTDQEAKATTEYTCEAGFVDLKKLTDGVVDPSMGWTFKIYEGPDGFGGTQVGSTGSTLGDADGILTFGDPVLRPDTTYTVCELGIPAGYSSQWQVDTGSGFATVIPYNPDADNAPPEDLGNRCVDFGDETAIPVTVGTTIHFQVDNRAPGGDPRTPGYWKNWNECTGGGQAATAAANGGWENGFWLLEDVLAQAPGIIWDDIKTNDTMTYAIATCPVAVDILDKRAVGDPATVGDGKKKASNPLHNLATHLLAAQLNFGAGACTTPTVLTKALAAETLLDKYNFIGTGYTGSVSKADANTANSLATYLDNYNNGMYCGSLIP